MTEDEFGETNLADEIVLSCPESAEAIYTPELVRLYHAKSRFFEVNVVPLEDQQSESLSKKTISLRTYRETILQKHQKKKKGLGQEDLLLARKSIESKQADIINEISNQASFKGRTLTIDDI